MQSQASIAIQTVLKGKLAFCKFLSGNDTGKTGAHQAGIYIPKPAVPIIFDVPGTKGEQLERYVTISWHGWGDTESRFIYYGQKTRNEYRVTRFGRGFPFLKEEQTGALFVFVKMQEDEYSAFVLNAEEEIDEFLDFFGISPTETNALLSLDLCQPEERERIEFQKFIEGLTVDFPSSLDISKAAQHIQGVVYDHDEYIISKPDDKLLDWTSVEYRLFKVIEQTRYGNLVSKGFPSMDLFIDTANQVLNRRKSRAGKSLEHHLAALFDGNSLQFGQQVVTEQNKRPDFIFPSYEAYHNKDFPAEKLVMLAAKTTCKDRWRQVINEADRLKGREKFLCTLQQGISSAQLDEMRSEKVTLVVPQPYIKLYPEEKRDSIWPLSRFIAHVKKLQG